MTKILREVYAVIKVSVTGGGWRVEFDHPTRGRIYTEVPRSDHSVAPRAGEELVFGEGEERRSVTIGGRPYVSSYPPVSQ